MRAENGKRQAFPGNYTPGITMREYFAGLAMQGMLANPERHTHNADGETWAADALGEASVRYADALLLALEQVKP